ncbi:MAG: hypothetical protein K940chlam7_00278 [Chlamydiae bacterium]|nr:hypothetical protein [Chlamydiota bacterium]
MFQSIYKRVGSKIFTILSFFMVIFVAAPLPGDTAKVLEGESKFTKEFRMGDCTFKSEGQNSFFILKPGYQLVLEGMEGEEMVRFTLSVLSDTKTISVPDIGEVTARVVEEREWADGKPIEFAKSYFAICEETGDVYDFGDSVDIFNDDGTVSHDGTWLVGEPDEEGIAMPGIFMPGTFLLGSKYFQQLADGLSMERVENVEMGMKMDTKAGTFESCVKVIETNSIEDTLATTTKIHCPGIGLVAEDDLMLIKYGYNIVDEEGKISEK